MAWDDCETPWDGCEHAWDGCEHAWDDGEQPRDDGGHVWENRHTPWDDRDILRDGGQHPWDTRQTPRDPCAPARHGRHAPSDRSHRTREPRAQTLRPDPRCIRSLAPDPMPLAFDRHYAADALAQIHGPDRADTEAQALDAHRRVLNGETRSPDMLGWRDMLLTPDDALLERVAADADEIRQRADVLLCIGIGGSYLGAEAVMQALVPAFSSDGPEILFAGNHLGPDHHERLFEYLDGKSVYVNVISKSGTTLEPALAFRLARRFLEERFDDADRRIIATTDADRGALHDFAVEKGYRRYVVPNDVGGRFSVLTPVGLLPIAAAGIDIRTLFYGAVAEARELTDADASHPALQYAADRFAFHEAGYATEVLAVMDPRLKGLGAWWQQLFGESEGKEEKGLFPVVLQYTTDLHSVGQYVQQGKRTLVETFLRLNDAHAGLAVQEEPGDPDGLNYLAGKPMGFVNEKAYEGTAEAHAEGGVPNWTLTLPRLDAETVGRLLYFYEHAVAVSGTMLGVDPFNQPGVETYKQKMFSLLGKP